MESVSKRLGRLEESDRDRAVAELRRAWASLSDEEAAVTLAPYAEWVQARKPTREEKEIRYKTRAAMSEELIARAIGLKDGMESGEVDRRIHVVLNRWLGIFERGEAIRRYMLAPSPEADK